MLKLMNWPWLATLVLQGLLGGVLWTKKMWRRFPLFVVYAISNLLFGVALFVIYRLAFSLKFLRPIYGRLYFVSELVGLLLGFAVVYEVFRHLFNPYPALRTLATQIFRGVLILLVLLSCYVAFKQRTSVQVPLSTASFLIVEQVTRILEVGLLGFLFVSASAFGLHWRQYVFGMALGLGVFAAVELVDVTMAVQVGSPSSAIFNIVKSFSCNVSLIIWISYILAPELATQPSEVPKRAQLEQWNRAVMELIYQ